MLFNGSSKIKDDGKDYVLLYDCGSEGFVVATQFKTLRQAMAWIATPTHCVPVVLMKLVRINAAEEDSAHARADDEG